MNDQEIEQTPDCRQEGSKHRLHRSFTVHNLKDSMYRLVDVYYASTKEEGRVSGKDVPRTRARGHDSAKQKNRTTRTVLGEKETASSREGN